MTDIMKKYIFIYTLLFAISGICSAQESKCFSPRLRTLQVRIGGEWGVPPVLILGSNNYVQISFDDLQGNYERYTYSITHCNADWTQSDLVQSEYMTGFNDNRIENYEPSMNTEMNYNHYTLNLPNNENRLLVSGNYIVKIFEDGEDAPVAQACFSIIEPHVSIDVDITANTDIDYYDKNQQLNFAINYSGYQVMNPVNEFKSTVLQNRRWDTHVNVNTPTSMQINRIIFGHNRNLIFPAGNEYRRFEILDEYVPTMHVDHMEYQDPYYHATIMLDEQRINYLYDVDQDGQYYVRNADDVENDTESDYFMTHFTLQMPQIPGGELYLNGDLTNNQYSEEAKMQYNIIDHQYECIIPLKQGSYNYQYLFVRDGESIGQTAQAEGNFHQTENEYWVYVYHRPFGLRYDKLVGFNRTYYKE